MMSLPFSPACERNKEPILEALQKVWPEPARIFELGSGTGQHAEFFSQHMPYLTWQPSDLADKLPGLEARCHEVGLSNLLPPMLFDARSTQLDTSYEGAYTANTFHIMPWTACCKALEQMGRLLKPGALCVIYGPFIEEETPLAPSNEAFDLNLKAQSPEMGLRTIHALKNEGLKWGLVFKEKIEMPAHNLILVFERTPG